MSRVHRYRTTVPSGPLEDSESALPEPAGREVLLRTLAAGVCHSDVHLHDTVFDLGNGRTLKAGGPGMTLGHEIAGEVVATGPDVRYLAPGTRCAVYPWIGCGRCGLCESGDEHLCARGRVIGIQRDGGFGTHVLVPDARYLFGIGDMDPALACTLGCSGLTAFSALRKLGTMHARDRLLVVGAGGVGLNAVHMAATLFGVRPLVADIKAPQRDAALAAGAESVFDPGAADALEAVLEATGGGAAAAIDFVGSEASSAFAQRSLRKGGLLLVVGLFGGTFSMPLPMIPMLARTIRGSYVGSRDEMAELVELARAGRIAPVPLVRRDASAAAATTALADLREGRVDGRAVLLFTETPP